MKVSTKLSAAFALHILILGALLSYHVRTTQDAVSTGRELSEISSRIGVTSIKQLARLVRLKESAAKYAVTRDPGYVERFHGLYMAYDEALQQLRALPLSRQERTEIETLAADWAAIVPLANALPDLAHRPPSAGARDSLEQLQRGLDALRLQMQRVSEASQATMAARLKRSALAARRAERLSWIAAVGALLLSIVISGLIVRSISEPLERLADGTREVARGRFDHRLDTRRGGEFAQVARDFNVMTERLAELDRMKHDFISKISHDLKTPLASMQETIDVLLDEVPGPLAEKQRQLLLLNRQSGQRLSSMLAKLLDLSRLDAGLEPHFQTVPVMELIQHAVKRVEPTRAGGRPEIIVGEPDRPLLLECDADRVHQLLDNLLENAIKFSPDRGEIRLDVHAFAGRPESVPPDRWALVRARRSSSHVLCVAVSDRGPGVPDEQKEQIFERFYQTDAGRAAHRRGVGLGLAICREIVDVHGGMIWVADRPGGGSVFTVLLPGALFLPRSDAVAATRSYDYSRS
jgi:two-component system sensor histidine kinase GlrK